MIAMFRCPIFVFLALLPLINSPVLAVETTQIDEVRRKEVLSPADFKIIDAYVNEAIEELLEITDFSSISIARSAILSRRNSDTISAQEQYAQQFFTSGAKYLKSAFEKTKQFPSKQRAEQMRLNLMILLDNMVDLRLVRPAIEMLNDENTTVRYWAVHAVTNPVIAEKLNSASSDNSELVKAVVEGLKNQLAKEKCPEILSLIIDFAGDLKGPEGRGLLLEIADNRIQKYENWTIDTELLDGRVLVLLCDAITSQREGRADVARRFAQLYSFAMQRYIKAMDNPGLLNSIQKQQLASVLVDVEQKCIGKLTEISQSAIKSAIEKENSSALLAEHNSLFGSSDGIGRIVRALDFNYGQNSDGSRRLIPRILPPRPKK